MIKKYNLEDIKSTVINKLKALDGDLIITEKSESELEIKSSKEKGMSMIMTLGNILTQINSGDDPTEVIDHRMKLTKEFLNRMKTMDDIKKWSFVKDKLIFVPMSKQYCEDVDKATEEKTKDKKGGPAKLYYKGFIQDIVLVGAMDFPGYFQYLTKDFFEDWKKTDDEIDEQIGKNMQKYETEYRVVGKQGIFTILTKGGEGILSTFLIKPRRLREIADEHGFKGKEVVGTIPFRDVIMFTEHNVENAMKLWTGSTAMIEDGARPYPVSSKPFMIDKEGVISQFKSDKLPGEGIMIGINPETKRVHTLALGKTNRDETLPDIDGMEEMLMKDGRIQKSLSVMLGATQGIPSKKFAEMVLGFVKDKEKAMYFIEKLIRDEWITTKRDETGVKIYPSPKTIKMMLNGKRGFDDSYDNEYSGGE